MKKLLCLCCFLTIAIAASAQSDPASPEQPFQISQFTTWSQRVDMSAYVGKKYRLTAAIRVDRNDPNAFALAFIRNEYPKMGLRNWIYMDNMMDNPAVDSTWKTYSLEYVVDKKAPWVGFGVLGFSNGIFYFDDLQLHVETAKDQWVRIPIANDGFENDRLTPWQQTVQGEPARVLGSSATIHPEQPFEGKQCMRLENNFLKN